MPGPERRKIDLEAHGATEALARDTRRVGECFSFHQTRIRISALSLIERHLQLSHALERLFGEAAIDPDRSARAPTEADQTDALGVPIDLPSRLARGDRRRPARHIRPNGGIHG